LQVVRHIADDVLVMYFGRAVEYAPKDDVFARPAHPYTRALLASTPSLSGGRRRTRMALAGELPSPLDPPSGCAFHTRCPHAVPRCATDVPKLETFRGIRVACHRVAELNQGSAD
jgi:dipeptide transport system ATP-binding protein